MKRYRWLDSATLCAIHDAIHHVTAGAPGLRDAALLESALARPQTMLAYGSASVFELAACLAEAIAHNHPFIDGNKRTALIAADVFLRLNGYQVTSDQQAIADLMVGLAAKNVTRAELAAFFAANSSKRS